MNDSIALERHYCAANYAPLPLVITRGEGCYLWDERGRRYLDMMSAYSALAFGHAHPRLVEALRAQAARLAVVSRAFYTDRLGLLLARVCELTGMDQALPMNTGAEAVETALKAARRWGYEVKGVPADRAEVMVCAGNFHGRTISIIGFSSEPDYKQGFGPFPPGFVTVPYGDAAALERAITPHTVAFLVEPIQGEGGIVVPPAGYLAQCAALCRRARVLFVADEVQTGLGRTGRLLACEHEGVRPDGLILGKALGGGLLPISLFLARREVMQVFRPGSHGSTFGGNPLAATVGLAALEVLLDEGLIERARSLGEYFIGELRTLRSEAIREVRGRGLLIGIDLDPGVVAASEFCRSLARHGILTKDTHGSVIRCTPPLIITREQIDWAVDRIAETLREYGAARRTEASARANS